MSLTSRRTVFIILIFIINGIARVQAKPPSEVRQLLTKIGDKISQTAVTIKDYLLELFYRFRAFFMGHSESTHNSVLSKGCGYAADDEPAIYTKQTGAIGKIKGGEDAMWHTWPWIVSLFTSPRHGWSCAGVLVNENTILTAAHCLTNTKLTDIKAIVGVHTVLGKLNPLNYYSLSAMYRHPNYTQCCKNDVAVLKLTKSVLYGPRINSVCVPFQPYATIERDEALVNRTGVIIGWGDSSRNAVKNMVKSFTLQQANVTIFDGYHCSRAYGYMYDPKTEICAGDYNQLTDTMSGDSGGPLLIRQADGRWVVLGITSYGSVPAPNSRNTLSLAPGVYARLSAYSKWLEPFIKSH